MKRWSACWWSLGWEAFGVHETSVRTLDDLPSDWEVKRLAQRLRDHLPDLRARHHIDSLALFGSYVRNEQQRDSDLDVLVDFTRTPSLFGLIHAEDDIRSCDYITSQQFRTIEDLTDYRRESHGKMPSASHRW